MRHTPAKSACPARAIVLGDLSIQGNIKGAGPLTEPLRGQWINGARRAMIPIENKRQFLKVNPDVLERVDPIF
jgi:ATP-dependent Lon protease